MRTLYCIAKSVTNTTSSRPGPIKIKDGTLLLDGEKKLASWAEHICEVLHQLDPTNPAQPKNVESILLINLNYLKEEEVWNAIKMLKNNKSPATDGITTKMLKTGGDETVQWLCQICN